jgi:hypothetical protein
MYVLKIYYLSIMLKYCVNNSCENLQSYKSFSVAIIHLLRDLKDRAKDERPFVLRMNVYYINPLLPSDTQIDLVFIDKQLNGWSTMNGKFCLTSETELTEFLDLYKDEDELDKNYMRQAAFYIVNSIDGLEKGIGCIYDRHSPSNIKEVKHMKVTKRLILPEKKEEGVIDTIKKISDKIENNATSFICSEKGKEKSVYCDQLIEIKKVYNTESLTNDELKKSLGMCFLCRQ